MSDVALTRVKIEQCNDEIKAENIPGEDAYGIKQEKLDAASLLRGTFECLENEWQKEAQYKSVNSDSAHKCKLCGKTFATNRYLALHMKIHSEQPDQSFDQSDSKFINDYNMSETIIIKSEYTEEDAAINYGEMHNDITEKTDETTKIINFDVTQVKKEQCDVEIKIENNPDSNLGSIQQEELNVEFIKCEEPSSSKNSKTTKTSTKPLQKCQICNKSFTRNNYLSHMRAHTRNKRQKCAVCSKEYKIAYMRMHMRTHTGEKTFVCEICGKAFRRTEDLKAHMNLHLGAERKFKCEICAKTFLRRKGLVGHMRLHSGSNSSHKCGTCNKCFATKKYLVFHMKLHTAELLECDICGKEVKSINLQQHVKAHTLLSLAHSELNSPHQCETCNKSFVKKKYLIAHMKIHNGHKMQKCEICSKEYAVTYMQKHMRMHTGEKPFECNICNKAYRKRDALKAHMSLHTGEEKKFKCDVCEKMFLRRDSLVHHLKLHSESDSSYNCEVCNKVFSTKRYLLRHEKRHTPQQLHKCDLCGKEFKMNCYLQQHIKLHTDSLNVNSDSSHNCAICNKSFAQKRYLDSHVKIHTGLRPFECEVCHKTFIYKHGLRVHMKIHLEQHKCDVCEEIFSTKALFLEHMKSHKGAKMHKCDICDKQFSRNDVLQQHIKRHSGEKLFKCHICDIKFAFQSSLCKHNKRRHGNKAVSGQ